MRKKIDKTSLFDDLAAAAAAQSEVKPAAEVNAKKPKVKATPSTPKVKAAPSTPKIEVVPTAEGAPTLDDLPWDSDKATTKKLKKIKAASDPTNKTPVELNRWLMGCDDATKVAELLRDYVLAGDKVRYAQAVERIYSRLNKLRGAMERKALKHGIFPGSIEALL